MSRFIKYENRAGLFKGLADVVENQLHAALSDKGRATLAVPGGTTPAPFFEHLRQRDLDWTNVTVLLSDERFVPESSDRSNTRLVREHLLQDKAAKAAYVPLYLPATTPEAVLDRLQAGIAVVLPLDVCVLGMGADMHTASLFPGADLLEQALDDAAPVLLPMRAPNAPEPRLTLTAPVLRGAAHVHVLITGAQKEQAFEKARGVRTILEAPIKIVQEQAQVHYAD